MAALCAILSLAEDLLVDIPKFWDFIAQVGVLQIEFSLILQMVFVTPPSQIVAPVLVPSGPLPLSSLKESAVMAKLLDEEQLGAKCAAGKYAAAVGVKYTYDFKTSQIRFAQLTNPGAARDEAGPRRGGGRLAGGRPHPGRVPARGRRSNIPCFI